MASAVIASLCLCLLLNPVASLTWEPQNQGAAPLDPDVPRPASSDAPLAHTPLPASPEQFFWNDVQGVNYLTLARNQHVPRYCGSCWAFAATSALSDRIKIARKAAFPDINISPQVLLSCGPSDGCHGGDAGKAYEWMAQNDVTDETCSIYQAAGHDNGLPCSDLSLCQSCSPGGYKRCYKPAFFHTYRVADHGPVPGRDVAEREAHMRAEIASRGPIACGMAVTRDLMNFTGPTVFHDKTGDKAYDHVVSIVGYGVTDDGVKYWLVRNSWGQYWGDRGFFKLLRGEDNLGIESNVCDWAVPKDTWSGYENTLTETSTNKVKSPFLTSSPVVRNVWKLLEDFLRFQTQLQQEKNEIQDRPRSHKTCRTPEKASFANGGLITSPLPSETVLTEELPDTWFWGDINGTNYLSWSVNQHIPTYCGSCWAQGTVSALSDRFIIMDPKKYANLRLSTQDILNTNGAGGGGCHGGNPPEVYEYVQKHGIGDNTCEQYVALDQGPMSSFDGPDIYTCRNCGGSIPETYNDNSTCWAVEKFQRYYVQEYGAVSGAEAMKKELYKRGPIGCGVGVNQAFEDYQGGIFEGTGPEINHEISVVGWGKDKETSQEYWIGRNSWGTYWGEYGFFRIKMHENNLHIEEDCVWGTPKPIAD